jgi:hypothetical protein
MVFVWPNNHEVSIITEIKDLSRESAKIASCHVVENDDELIREEHWIMKMAETMISVWLNP